MTDVKRAVIFSKPSCPFCVKAKQLLDKNNIEYQEHIIGEDCEKIDMQRCVDLYSPQTKVNTVPQIFLFKNEGDSIKDGEYVGGCDEFYKYMGES